VTGTGTAAGAAAERPAAAAPGCAQVAVSEPWREFYSSDGFAELIDAEWMPWLTAGLELGDDLLCLAAGPAFGVRALAAVSKRVTIAETDPAFTTALAGQYGARAGIEVTGADPLRLPFPDGRFSGAAAVLCLHHLPAAQLQDQALAEVARVLRPGGMLAGLNVLDGPQFRALNAGGSCAAIDPLTLPPLLRRAGFADVHVDAWLFPRFTGRVPEQSGGRRGGQS
jgi:SAM-dependent methyltransferase